LKGASTIDFYFQVMKSYVLRKETWCVRPLKSQLTEEYRSFFLVQTTSISSDVLYHLIFGLKASHYRSRGYNLQPLLPSTLPSIKKYSFSYFSQINSKQVVTQAKISLFSSFSCSFVFTPWKNATKASTFDDFILFIVASAF